MRLKYFEVNIVISQVSSWSWSFIVICLKPLNLRCKNRIIAFIMANLLPFIVIISSRSFHSRGLVQSDIARPVLSFGPEVCSRRRVVLSEPLLVLAVGLRSLHLIVARTQMAGSLPVRFELAIKAGLQRAEFLLLATAVEVGVFRQFES